MKHAIACNIETVTAPGEDAWIITIDHADVPDAVILLTALGLGKIKQIRLADRRESAVIRSDSLTLADTTVPITSVWLDAVCSLLVDICLKGWTNTAHLDADFGKICVCIAAAPPTE